MQDSIFKVSMAFEAAFGRFRMEETRDNLEPVLRYAKQLEVYIPDGELKEIVGEHLQNLYIRAIEIAKNWGYKFCVYEDDKPCILTGPNWRDNKFETFEDAVKYLRNWLGPQYVDALPEKVEVDTVYDIFDMKFVIKKEKI